MVIVGLLLVGTLVAVGSWPRKPKIKRCGQEKTTEAQVICLAKGIEQWPEVDGYEKAQLSQAFDQFKATIGEENALWQVNYYSLTDDLGQKGTSEELGTLDYHLTGARQSPEGPIVLIAKTQGVYSHGVMGMRAVMYVFVENLEDRSSNYPLVMIRPV